MKERIRYERFELMQVTVEKDKKGSTYIISVKSNGFTKQLNVDFAAMTVLYILLGRILKGRT